MTMHSAKNIKLLFDVTVKELSHKWFRKKAQREETTNLE
jgi:hypothetical protein